MFFYVSPNDLEGLGTGNLRNADERLHLRRYAPGLHNASRLPAGGSGLVRRRGEGHGADKAQISRRELRSVLEGGGGSSGDEQRRFAGEKCGDESHGQRLRTGNTNG